MFTLTRTVRFSINPGDSASSPGGARGPNGYAGVPALRGLGRHYELDVACTGPLDPVKGYLINIKDVDTAVRTRAIPMIAHAAATDPAAEPAGLMRAFFPLLSADLGGGGGGSGGGGGGGGLSTLRWRLSPYHSLEMHSASTSTVLMRQRFEFAASHRLHNPSLSPEDNRRLYGKCNHPSGHGHNYVVEPCVRVSLDSRGGTALSLGELERIVSSLLIERFDHKHLNLDIPEFSESGFIPSVENIARVSYEILKPAIESARAELRDVTVWETEKTSSTYPAI